MMEVSWGTPVRMISTNGTTPVVTTFSTIEQVQHWLKRKWPVDDTARHDAIDRVEAAMDCLLPVSAARHAFFTAAESAGYRLI